MKKKKTGDFFALKILSIARGISLEDLRSIAAERNVFQMVKHENCLGAYYAFIEHNQIVYCMDYMQGGDLGSIITKVGYFIEDEVKYIAASVINGLKHLHDLVISHRDIKPLNMMVSS